MIDLAIVMSFIRGHLISFSFWGSKIVVLGLKRYGSIQEVEEAYEKLVSSGSVAAFLS